MSRYKLSKFIKDHREQLERRGYSTYDKILMPTVIQYILKNTGLRVDGVRLAQCLGHLTV